MLAAPPLAALVRRMTPDSEGIPDAELVERFAKSADQAAFELLVWRHGAMVWSACRRMLSHHAAEDACQATFLALSMHAPRLRNCSAVAAWLHRVAVRASLDLLAARRSGHSLADDFDPIDRHPGPEQLASDREVRLAIDSGLDRLPDSLRIPFVLCELEGRTNVQAAAALGCAVGTVESSLTRARKRLRKWLGSRGLAPAAAVTSAVLPGSLHAALVSVGARTSFTPAIRTLAERAVRSTMETNLRFAYAVGVAMLAAAIGFSLEGGDAPKNPGTPTAKVAEPKAAEVNVPGFPEGAVARLGSPRLRHGSRLKDIAYSPNGKRIASVGHDNSVRVWDAESGLQLFSVTRSAGGFDRVSFAAEGTVIVALGSDSDKKGALWRIDAANGQVLDRLKIEATMPSYTAPNAAVRFSADGSRLALGSVDKKRLLVFETVDAKPAWTADLGQEVPGGVAFASDGKAVAVATNAGRVHLFDRDGKPTTQLKTEENAELSSVALSSDGKRVTARIGNSFAAKLIAWDRETARILWTRERRGGLGLAFTPDSKLIVDCGSGYFASIVDAADGLPPGRQDATFDSVAEVCCLAIHPVGKVVAFGTESGTICLRDVMTRKPVPPTADPVQFVQRLRFSADGKTVYGWALDWFAWEVGTGKQRNITNRGGWNFTMPLSPDGRYTTHQSFTGGLLARSKLEVRDIATDLTIHSFDDEGFEGGFGGIEFTPDGKGLIGGENDGSMQVRSLDGEVLARMNGHKGQVVYRAFSASAPVMVTATLAEPPEEFPVRVWDLKTGKELGKFNPGVSHKGNGYPYGSLVALSGDGKRVASLTYTNSYGKPMPKEHATVWDVASGKVLAKVPQGGDSGCIALSPDGRLVAVSALWKNEVWVYEVAGGGERFHFRTAGEVTSLVFAPDGRTLASASKDAPIYLWDVREKKR